MRKWIMAALAGCMIAGCASTVSAASAGKIRGDYLETRSADVYAGACVANSEVNLSGDQAILAWHIKEGSWNGVVLDGLGVVGVVKANATLGDPFTNPYPAKSVLIVDSRATAEQQAALKSFAQSKAGELLQNVVKVESAPIQIEVGEGERHGYGKLAAGLAHVETRSMHGKDHLCGNEEVYYQPLTELMHAMPVFTLNDEFSGRGLGVTWKLNGKRSSFVGHFSYATPAPVISMK
ncbi:MAG: DUF1326 domain-containing protein [Acidobacteria bacterium]|nr:DUF1326 domain-containing protein [Acidobacteriota bacterium]